jgi:RHS repeat-associated protein
MKYPANNSSGIGEQVSYSYLPQMLLDTVRSDASPNYYYLQKAGYDAIGRVDYQNLGATSLAVNPLLVNNFDYYPWNSQGGRLQYLKSGVYASQTSLQDLAYAYDLAGNILTILDGKNSNQRQCFSYDTLRRLTKATTYQDAAQGCSVQLGNGNYSEDYTYDGNTGNLLSKTGNGTYDYDPQHKHAVIKLAGVQKYWYDANGNMLTRISGGGTYSFAYDSENRLASVSGAATASFVYDGDGNRVKGTVSAVTSVYIGNYLEWTGSTSTMKKYYYSGANRLAMRVGTGTGTSGLTWLVGDHLGSTSKTANGATGAQTDAQLYKAWGENRWPTTSTLPTTYRYTGQRQELGLGGLYFFGARWYDSVLSRFLQADIDIPTSQGVQGHDRYAFVNNNPLRYVDPSGHNIWDTIEQFARGFVYEFARTNAWYSSHAQNILSVNAADSDAMLAGRVAADIATIVVGVAEVAAGITTATGGTVVACVGTACVGAVATVGAGAAVTAYGAVTTMSGAAGLGGNIALLSGSSGNPNPWQIGDPINNPTAHGYPSWSTVQRRYWQNRAKNALPGEFSIENLERMKNGLPPLHEE